MRTPRALVPSPLIVAVPQIVAVALIVAVTLAGCATAGGTVPTGPTGATTTTGAPDPSGSPSGMPPSPAPDAGSPTLPGTTVPGSPVKVITNGPRTGTRVAITFDSNMTDAMLANLDAHKVASYANVRVVDILERRQVPATFFLAGKWVQRYPEVTRRLAANPRFELASHSYRHEGFTPKCYGLAPLAPSLMAEDVTESFRILAPYGGHQSRYFRFPGGCYDAKALAAVAADGITVIQWDVVSGDAFATAWQPIVKAVLNGVRPGSIIVMHITEDNARFTDKALPDILDGLKAKGLQPVMLSELLSAGAGGGAGRT